MEEEEISKEGNLSDDILKDLPPKKNFIKKSSFSTKLIIIGLISLTWLIFCFIIIPKELNSSSSLSSNIEIISIYEISSNSSKSQILNSNFIKPKNFFIYIDGVL